MRKFKIIPVGFAKGVNSVNLRSLRPLSALVILTLLLATVAPAVSAQGEKHRKKDQRPPTGTDQANGKKVARPGSAGERFQISPDGKTAHDNLLHVTWLLDANVGKGQCSGVSQVGKGGGMDWNTAWNCIKHLNSGNGYLGHANWQMPSTPNVDPTCKATGADGNSFAEDCRGSAYGSLFYLAFQRHFGETVARQLGPTIGGFRNLQPSLYWAGNSLGQASGVKKKNPYNGYNSFSFSNGWQGGNVDHHVMYILPIIPGPVPAGSPAAKATIYDRTAASGVPGKTGVTWLADANIASDPNFLKTVHGTGLNIRSDGAMEQSTAQRLISLMQQYKYLGRADWALPLANATNCTLNGKSTNAGYHCTVSAMGHLYYEVFKLNPGAAVADPTDISNVKPFSSVQPSLYWACAGAKPTISDAGANLCASTTTAASGMGFSFDMGTGFTDTTVLGSDLYLMVYYPDPPSPTPPNCTTPQCRCAKAGGTWSGGRCQ
jgi:hypothetical protein